MKIEITKANIKRLASLSALGAGAVAAGQASSVVFSGPINTEVGFCGPDCHNVDIAGPGGAHASLFGAGFCSSLLGCVHDVSFVGSRINAHGTVVGARWEGRTFAASAVIAAFPAGAVWGTGPGSARIGAAAASQSNSSGLWERSLTLFNATDRYFLFRFSGGDLPHDIYGWAQLTVDTVPGTNCFQSGARVRERYAGGLRL